MSTSELNWSKSSHSSAQGDDCVEIAVTEPTIHLRDSKDTTRPHITIGRLSWAAFIHHAAHGWGAGA
ncbi:DUF397 domain-containing protein [Streptomyces sp. NPDC003077]|uniref:DUF397 domain-containing protein n=1 Tax=Streptomyces sp. NPDC003077 TaxID=3154443 RepID=UPI0033BCA56E